MRPSIHFLLHSTQRRRFIMGSTFPIWLLPFWTMAAQSLWILSDNLNVQTARQHNAMSLA